MKVCIGIDPGNEGAVAFLFENGRIEFSDAPTGVVKRGKVTRRVLLPAGMNAIFDSLDDRSRELASAYDVKVYLEQVGAMPKQGLTSTFNFGMGYGIWQGILAARGLPYRFVTPNEWKKEMMSGMGKDKDASVVQAQRLFPDAAHLLQRPKRGGGVMLLNGRADALLIAAWGRKQG